MIAPTLLCFIALIALSSGDFVGKFSTLKGQVQLALPLSEINVYAYQNDGLVPPVGSTVTLTITQNSMDAQVLLGCPITNFVITGGKAATTALGSARFEGVTLTCGAAGACKSSYMRNTAVPPAAPVFVDTVCKYKLVANIGVNGAAAGKFSSDEFSLAIPGINAIQFIAEPNKAANADYGVHYQEPIGSGGAPLTVSVEGVNLPDFTAAAFKLLVPSITLTFENAPVKLPSLSLSVSSANRRATPDSTPAGKNRLFANIPSGAVDVRIRASINIEGISDIVSESFNVFGTPADIYTVGIPSNIVLGSFIANEITIAFRDAAGNTLNRLDTIDPMVIGGNTPIVKNKRVQVTFDGTSRTVTLPNDGTGKISANIFKPLNKAGLSAVILSRIGSTLQAIVETFVEGVVVPAGSRVRAYDRTVGVSDAAAAFSFQFVVLKNPVLLFNGERSSYNCAFAATQYAVQAAPYSVLCSPITKKKRALFVLTIDAQTKDAASGLTNMQIVNPTVGEINRNSRGPLASAVINVDLGGMFKQG